MTDFLEAAVKADELIAGEVARQDAMWGAANERTDSSQGQLFRAAFAQQQALLNRMMGTSTDPFGTPPEIYPKDWSGFRDYGSDVANLAVAAAFIRQEMKRLIASGADTTRKSRDVASQPYKFDQPAIQPV